MANDLRSDRPPERPRSEPEIIPPGSADGVFRRSDNRQGVYRITIARPGLPSVLLGLFILGALAGLVVLVIAGVLLIAIPLLIAGVLLALFYGPVRSRWRYLANWLFRRRG